MVRRHTRRTGQFDYRATPPPNSDTEAITADLASGVLTARVPRTEAAKAHRIAITG